MEENREKLFTNDAKTMVDTMYDNRLFKDDVTRDDMNAFEDLIDFLLSSRYTGYKRMQDLMERIEENKKS